MARAKVEYRRSLKTERLDLVTDFLEPNSGTT